MQYSTVTVVLYIEVEATRWILLKYPIIVSIESNYSDKLNYWEKSNKSRFQMRILIPIQCYTTEVSLPQAAYFDLPQIGVQTIFFKQNHQLIPYFS